MDIMGFIIAAVVILAIGYPFYKILNKARRAADKGVNKLIHGESRQSAQELLATNLVFETSADREKIVTHFFNIYPVERKALELKENWICDRRTDGKGDDLTFVIGVRAFEYVDTNSQIPITAARLRFDTTPSGMTKAAFGFVLRIAEDKGLMGAPPHLKNMAELLEAVKDGFMQLDASCKITEEPS
jgi:hypothetical protein